MWECEECKYEFKEFGKCWSKDEMHENKFFEKGCTKSVMYRGSYVQIF